MAFDKDQISQKLAQLEEYISKIRKYGQSPESEFTADSMVEAAAERAIYSDLGFGPPRFYRDLFVQLGQHGVISQELQPKLEAMAGLRNKLAHEYAVIKPKEIYQVAKQDYQDLIEFAKQISSYLKNLAP
jgi:uncharacterized protein YutE (UPF0331/DUF86 family)